MLSNGTFSPSENDANSANVGTTTLKTLDDVGSVTNDESVCSIEGSTISWWSNQEAARARDARLVVKMSHVYQRHGAVKLSMLILV